MLLSEEMSDSLISAYLRACRQLTRQWATNIVFCEQQTMTLGREEEQRVLSAHHQGSRSGDGGAGDASSLTQGIITLGDEDGKQLWFTELHIDLFRIVHEHVE